MDVDRVDNTKVCLALPRRTSTSRYMFKPSRSNRNRIIYRNNVRRLQTLCTALRRLTMVTQPPNPPSASSNPRPGKYPGDSPPPKSYDIVAAYAESTM